MATAPKPSPSTENQEFLEVKSVSLEWKLSNLKQIFDTSKGEAKSKCVKSLYFGDGKWQVFFYPNSGHDQYCSLYLSCQPTNEEIEKAGQLVPSLITPITTPTAVVSAVTKPLDPAQVPWQREGLFKFTFEIKSLDRRTTYKTMEANDHAFSHEARNWGWAQYWRRNDAYYCNPSAKYNDAFLICCTIVYSPTPPHPTPPTNPQKRSIPLDLLQAYSSLFNDPTYSDVCFHIIRPSHTPRKLYAAKKILIRRAEYFGDMFASGFAESMKLVPESQDIPEREREEEEEDELMIEDSDDDDEEEEDYEDGSGGGNSAFSSTSASNHRERAGSLDTGGIAPARDEGTDAPATVTPLLSSTPIINKPIARHRLRVQDSDNATGGAVRTVVEVTDAAYTTFKALLFFLYTDSITFAPLSSTYRCLRDAAESNGQRYEHATRRAFIRASVGSGGASTTGAGGHQETVVCSAKAIYRLADKLNLSDLKSRAYDHITRSLTVQNIPMEVFSAFTSAYPEIRKVQVDYMLSHWSELRDSDSLRNVLKLMPGFADIWALVLAHLEYRPRPIEPGLIGSSNSTGPGGASGSGEGSGTAGGGDGEGHRSVDAA